MSTIAIGSASTVPDSVFAAATPLALPFFTVEQVGALLHAFSTEHGVMLCDNIIEDVFQLTAGHPLLVGFCGRALESPSLVSRSPASHISLAAWRRHRARYLVHYATKATPLATMRPALGTMPAPTLQRLLLHLALPDLSLPAVGGDLPAARQLASDGWLVPTGAANAFRMTSPLARLVALNGIAGWTPAITLPVPETPDGYADVHQAIMLTLPLWNSAAMRRAFAEARSSAGSSRTRMVAAQVAPYHTQLFVVLQRWLSRRFYTCVLAEADCCDAATVPSTAAPAQHADMMLYNFDADAATHLLRVVVNATADSIAAHCSRVWDYMATNKGLWNAGVRGACIAFTAVDDAADVTNATAARFGLACTACR